MFLFAQAIIFSLMTGCTKAPPLTNTTMNDTTNNIDTSGNFSWLALGDSYTIGQSVGEEERFPAQTISLLKNDSLYFSQPQYIAETGWTTINLLDAINAKQPKPPFDVVTLLIGVNDQYQQFDINLYQQHFTACLQKALALAGNKKEHVFVLSIPDYSVTPFGQSGDTAKTRAEIDEYNSINKSVTQSYGISYTDITPLTRDAKNDATLIAPDGLHPSGKEYAAWAALLAPEIEKALH